MKGKKVKKSTISTSDKLSDPNKTEFDIAAPDTADILPEEQSKPTLKKVVLHTGRQFYNPNKQR